MDVLQPVALAGGMAWASGMRLYAVLFLADKIAIVDSLWDGIQGFIRIPAGALLAALALGGHDPAWMVAAGLLGGAVTAGTHLAKAGSRAMINTSPEPFSNIAASLGEDALAVSGLWAAIFYPALFLILLGLFLLLLIWLLPKLGGGVLAVFGGLFGWTKKQ